MLSAIIQQVTGKKLVEYLQPKLFDPLDIKPPQWQSDLDGINVGGTGLFVTTMDIAKFGQLYLQKGNWKGQQILPEAWVEEATSLQTSNGSNPESDWDQGYGYQFWRSRNNVYRGDGAFGQYCIVMPEQDAVLAITSGSSDMQGILNLVWNNILAGMYPDALPANQEALSALNDKLKDLAISTVEGQENAELGNEISGKTYKIEENQQQIDEISFNLNGNEKVITLTIEGNDQEIPIGYHTMLKGQMNIARLGNVAVASSGAWTSENTYRATMYNYESPHAITFDFTFDKDKLFIDTKYNVTFGGSNQPQMKGTLE